MDVLWQVYTLPVAIQDNLVGFESPKGKKSIHFLIHHNMVLNDRTLFISWCQLVFFASNNTCELSAMLLRNHSARRPIMKCALWNARVFCEIAHAQPVFSRNDAKSRPYSSSVEAGFPVRLSPNRDIP